MGERAFLRSRSLPSFRSNGNIDEGLSRGSRGSPFTRGCIQGIPPRLNDDEISPLKKELESERKELESERKELESVKKELESVKKELESERKEHESVKKERDRLEKELKDVQEKYDKLLCALELREILSKFLKSSDVNTRLMTKAHLMFPNEFLEMKFLTFTVTIRKLLEANEGTEHKLNCLQEVAKSFRLSSLLWWDEEMGERVYKLCINVARWNESDFHPKIEGVTKCRCMNKARKGLYKFDGVDFGPFVKEALHTPNAPRTRGRTT